MKISRVVRKIKKLKKMKLPWKKADSHFYLK